MIRFKTFAVRAAVALSLAAIGTGAAAADGKYADINGLHMYYEVHGKGAPILLIHGGLCTIEVCFGPLIEKLAATRQVIAYEFQGHGRTADIDRPLRSSLLADDAAKLLKHLGIAKADVLGYSIGAAVAFELAVTHPEQVNKLVTMSLLTTREGGYEEMFKGMSGMSADMFKGSPWLEGYNKVAPHPEQFPALLRKIVDWSQNFKDVPLDAVKTLQMPTFFILGDADMVRPEHAAELFRAVGGGVFGDVVPVPPHRLAILPGTTHVTLIQREPLIADMTNEFLDAPPPKK